jgi:hypothetical protein
MSLLLASCNEFAETPMEVPLDGSITRSAPYRGYTPIKLLQRARTRVELSNGVRSVGEGIKSPPKNGPHCFPTHGHIYHLISLL